MKSLRLFAVAGFLGFAPIASTAPAMATGIPAINISSDAVQPYIVVLKDSVGDPGAVASDIGRQFRGALTNHVYTSAIKGFSVSLPSSSVALLKADPRVQFVSEDRVVQASAQIIPTGVGRVGSPVATNMGTGVGVAIIDSGISTSHTDLAPNIVAQKNCTGWALYSSYFAANANDDNGHGTHVAGTVSAVNNTVGVVGVASAAKLIAVKVLDSNGAGTWSQIICGIDWVTANAAKYNIKVANMSLGGAGASDNNCGSTNSDALHRAICRSTAAGVTYVVAAGNNNADASTLVPAAYDDSVITVSALADSDGKPGGLGAATTYGADDTFASFSNYGKGVDIAAPGVAIYSTWLYGGYQTISGTSMAAPHVSGAAALYIKNHPGLAWSAVRDALVATGESTGSGHSDPSGKHLEPVLRVGSF